MSYTTLISTAELVTQLDNPDWVIVDCRFALTNTAKGAQEYLTAHIPGAVYAHLDRDLSGAIIPGQTGRHPLPDVDSLTATLSSWGIGEHTQVVAYDDAGGMYAGRLWWMLRWLGHDAVAVLDGDWRAWVRESRPTASGVEEREPRRFFAHVRPHMQASVEEVQANLYNPATRLIDARAADRYRGENETLDSRAGHIPGAACAHHAGNLAAAGYFRSVDELHSRFAALLGDIPAEQCIVYCGSGVSAAHNILAMEYAGLPGARLYVGSWSEWITDPSRPIVTSEVA